MNTVLSGRKILVLGCSGSGKSTFAKQLHALTGLPLIHLDNIWWKEDRTHITREEFDRKLSAILEEDAWIIDGDYSRTYEMRIRACDTVIVLDYEEAVCMKGITERIGKPRPDIPWIEEEPDPELEELVHNYQTANRPKLYALLERCPEKQTVIFQNRTEAEVWLTDLKHAL